jgi:hypothetical protein
MQGIRDPNLRWCVRAVVSVVVWILSAGGACLLAGDGIGDFLATPGWTIRTNAEVAIELKSWLEEQSLSASDQAAILARWEMAGESARDFGRLDTLAETFARVDPRVANVIEHCQTFSAGLLPAEWGWLDEPETPRLVRNNMRLYFARWQTQVGLYDEALVSMAGLSARDVVAPDTLLFCRAVAHHFLVHPAEAGSLAGQLLERESELPERYQQLARLIVKDVERLEDESLDHIARRMSDIQRRLVKGRAGKTVQGIEQGVIDSLDKMIEELEEQQQQSAGKGQARANSGGKPMQDSRLAEMQAPGKVEQRDIGNKSGWGDLPPKEREQALQQIGREFPAHYREVIEQYFRELARGQSANAP